MICPESLHDKFAERSSISKYDTRNKTDLQIPRLNLDFSRKSFNYTGLKTWNSIPTHIRQSGTLTRFKNGLKSHFLSWGTMFSMWTIWTMFYVFARIHGRTVLAFVSTIKHTIFCYTFLYGMDVVIKQEIRRRSKKLHFYRLCFLYF